MERGDIVEVVRLGKHYIDKAEQARWHVMECQKRYDEAMSKLDKLRRRMVFVEDGTPNTLELLSALMELEEVKEDKKGAENKLKNFITASISYTLSAVDVLNTDSSYINSRIIYVLRQTVVIIRAIRELNIDFSSISSQVVQTRIIVNYKSDVENRIRYVNISRYLNQLMHSLE